MTTLHSLGIYLVGNTFQKGTYIFQHYRHPLPNMDHFSIVQVQIGLWGSVVEKGEMTSMGAFVMDKKAELLLQLVRT